ncbi:protein BTG3-like [Pleurodeles waltl]|uniref:protein BTG3-like n=1 Tax=Pleurodeles waltl TaxID=8319 RepID=UPI0037096740
MRAEIEAGVSLILKLINRRRKFHPRRVERFGEVLNSLLLLKYDGHWYPDDPTRGQAYRCIRINPWQYVDESVLKACAQSGLVYSKMPFPVEITLWIDPYEVSCRLAENKASFLVAKFCRPLNYFKNLASREPETSDYHSEASSENPSESSDDEVSPSLTAEGLLAIPHQTPLDSNLAPSGCLEREVPRSPGSLGLRHLVQSMELVHVDDSRSWIWPY